MFDKLTMKSVPMIVENLPPLSLADVKNWAVENLDTKKAWLLAESPRQVIWGRFADKISAPALDECLFLLAFDQSAETRFYRQQPAAQGFCRHVAENPQGKPTLARYSSCLIKNSGGKLEVAEHFMLDENGVYKFTFERYCGVSGN